VVLIAAQTLGSVKSTQSKEYKKLKLQLTSQANPNEKRKVSFDTSEEEDKSSDLSLEILKEKEVSDQDFNQEIDH
jgi:hypothetical protein